MNDMTSSRPYLIRAIYEWLLDNGQTPYLLINTEYNGVVAPKQFVRDGKIVLNISPNAVHNLAMSNDEIVFGARFGGKLMEIYVPTPAVLSIYSKENGLGMNFQEEKAKESSKMPESKEQTTAETRPPAKPDVSKRPKLTIVK